MHTAALSHRATKSNHVPCHARFHAPARKPVQTPIATLPPKHGAQDSPCTPAKRIHVPDNLNSFSRLHRELHAHLHDNARLPRGSTVQHVLYTWTLIFMINSERSGRCGRSSTNSAPDRRFGQNPGVCQETQARPLVHVNSRHS